MSAKIKSILQEIVGKNEMPEKLVQNNRVIWDVTQNENDKLYEISLSKINRQPFIIKTKQLSSIIYIKTITGKNYMLQYNLNDCVQKTLSNNIKGTENNVRLYGEGQLLYNANDKKFQNFTWKHLQDIAKHEIASTTCLHLVQNSKI